MPRLNDLWGQEPAVAALRRALQSGQLPGSYLFTGPPGTGRNALALAFAQAAACQNPDVETIDACGECQSCRYVQNGAHPEIAIIEPAGDQTQIWQLWDRDGKPAGVLSSVLSFSPAVGRKRVFIVTEAETLNPAAANSLLKVLEEPPAYALFILIAPHPGRVLATILSRCQHVRVRAMPEAQLAENLVRLEGLPPERAALLAGLAEGAVGKALAIARAPGLADEIERIFEFAETLPGAPVERSLVVAEQMRKLAGGLKLLAGPPSSAAARTEEAAKTGAQRQQLAALFDILLVFYRDLARCSAGPAAGPPVRQHRAAHLADLAHYGHCDRWMRCGEAIVGARGRLERFVNVGLLTETLAIQLLS